MHAVLTEGQGIEAIPKPDTLRGDLVALSRRLRLTRQLLKLAEQVHPEGPPPQRTGRIPAAPAPEVANAG